MAVVPHYWTVASRFGPPPAAPEAREWSTTVDDPTLGPLRLTGLLREEPGSTGLLLFVHGIGGSAQARYALRVAQAASAAGLSCLRFNLRGCDRRGGDYYHAGLSSDLGVALAAPDLAHYQQIYLLGFSMGGHLVLRHAALDPDPRLRAVAAVCAPLDLAPAGRFIDQPLRWPYRRYVLRNLLEIYTAVAATRPPTQPVPLPVSAAAKLATISEWDRQVVAPRWGFRDHLDYYAQASVGPHLGRLAKPALLIAAERDPLVSGEAVRPAAERARDVLETRWVRNGGHVGFPRDLSLAIDAPRGIEGQAIGWLLSKN